MRIPLPFEGQPLTLKSIVDYLSSDVSTPLHSLVEPERDPSKTGRAQVRLWIPDPASTSSNRQHWKLNTTLAVFAFL